VAILELDGLRKAFGNVVVADGLSFSVAAGETVGMVGPNGAGKTSILNLIAGNIAPDAGRVMLDGQDITGVAAHARARMGLGRTHQVPRPFEALTVFENALLGADHAGRERRTGTSVEAAVAALEVAELLPRANVLARSLPLLDRKRLELARALATQPRVLLLDEIAGGLTEPEIESLTATIRRLGETGVAVIWIEHIVAALLQVVRRLIAIDAGRILADGEPPAVLADPAVRAVYLGQHELVA
jgi:branched-chain amino acid transport system ATP-binding protein